MLSVADLQSQLTLQKEERDGDREGGLGQTKHVGQGGGCEGEEEMVER